MPRFTKRSRIALKSRSSVENGTSYAPFTDTNSVRAEADTRASRPLAIGLTTRRFPATPTLITATVLGFDGQQRGSEPSDFADSPRLCVQLSELLFEAIIQWG